MRQVLSLVRNGVPWEIAIDLSTAERIGYIVALGEIDGRTFDWRTMKWRDS